jgi:hypothetical protein
MKQQQPHFVSSIVEEEVGAGHLSKLSKMESDKQHFIYHKDFCTCFIMGQINEEIEGPFSYLSMYCV